MSSASRIEGGALLYELKRFLRPRLYKVEIRDREWCVPVGMGLVNGLLNMTLMLFLGTFLYFDVPSLLVFVAGVPMIIAHKAWWERNPLLKDPPREFILSLGFTRKTWYRASLLSGFLLSLLFGALMIVLLIVYYSLNPEYQPVDRGVLLEISALPMASGLFYLVNLSCERSREVRNIKSDPSKPTLLQRIETMRLIEYVLPLFFFIYFFMTIWVWYLWILCAVVVIGAVVGRVGVSSLEHARMAFVLTGFTLYATVFYILDTHGIKIIPFFLGKYFEDVRTWTAVIVVGVFFLYAARRALKPYGREGADGREYHAA